MKQLFLVAIITLIATYAGGQVNYPEYEEPVGSSGLAANLGASVTYYYGLPDRNFGAFENDRVNWQLDGLVGFTLGRDRTGKRTLIAAFGNFGFLNASTTKLLLQDQRFTTSLTTQQSTNSYYRIEAGLLLAEILRLSIGKGEQFFADQTLVDNSGVRTNTNSLKFNSGTVGLQFNLSKIALALNVHFSYGDEFDRTILMPAAGLQLKL